MFIRKYISNFKKQTGKKNNNKNTKKAKRIKEEKRIFPKKWLKKQTSAARVKIFLVIRIAGNNSFFFFCLGIKICYQAI